MKTFFYEGEIHRVFCEKYDIIEQMDDKAKDALLSEAIEMIDKLTDAQLYRIMEEMKNDEPAE